MTNAYEVERWDERLIPGTKKVVFKRREDMENARRDIMNDRDIIFKSQVKGQPVSSHVPYTLLKQGLYDGEIVFESEGDG